MKLLKIAVLLAGCALAFGGEISEIHHQAGRDKTGPDVIKQMDKSRSHEEVDSTKHGITEIGIERTPCYGDCPVFTFIVKSDGTFRYHGVKNVEHLGDHTGKIADWKYHPLAQFIKDAGYMELEDGYSRMVTDSPTAFTMVVMDGKRKTVRNHADSGPTKLWAIENLIDDLLKGAMWDAKGDAPAKELEKK